MKHGDISYSLSDVLTSIEIRRYFWAFLYGEVLPFLACIAILVGIVWAFAQGGGKL